MTLDEALAKLRDAANMTAVSGDLGVYVCLDDAESKEATHGHR